MKITIRYKSPTPSHCEVDVFVNGALTGTLTLRQEELDVFQDWLKRGAVMPGDRFTATGDPGPLARVPIYRRDLPDDHEAPHGR